MLGEAQSWPLNMEGKGFTHPKVKLKALEMGIGEARVMGSNQEDFLAEEVSPEKFFFSVTVHVYFFISRLLLLLFCPPVCPSFCLYLNPPDPKLCPIPMTPNGHLDPNLPLGGHLGPTGAAASAPRLSLQPDPVLMALGSRKSSVMSLGRVSYDQRSLVSPCGVLWMAASCRVCAE